MGFLGSFLGLIFRRGTGIVKFVFAVDDLIRLFAMTLILFLALTILGLSKPAIMAGAIIGLIIDVQDIIDDIQSGKPIDLGFN